MQSKAERREEPNNLPGQRNRDVVSARPGDDIAALVERAKSADTSLGSETLTYAVVDHIQAEAIENATGLDVRGFTKVTMMPAAMKANLVALRRWRVDQSAIANNSNKKLIQCLIRFPV